MNFIYVIYTYINFSLIFDISTFYFIHEKIKLYADPQKISSIIIEASKMGESNFNNNLWYWQNAMFFTIRQKCGCSSGYSEYLLKEKRFKDIANCDQTNQQEPSFHCMNRFMDSESSCNIPWLNAVKTQKVFFSFILATKK